jgi:peroxiredoxin
MIDIGDCVPDTTLQIMTESGPADVTALEIFGGKSVMLFGAPGAFTPSCHYIHMPGFLDELETLRRAGIDTVACTAVNDAFVLDVWADATGAKGKILFLGDGNADFVTATGLELDARTRPRPEVAPLCHVAAGRLCAGTEHRGGPLPSPKRPPPMPCSRR